MNSKMFVDQPDTRAYTLMTTMTLKEWKQVRNALKEDNCFVARCFIDHINRLVLEAENQFFAYNEAGET